MDVNTFWNNCAPITEQTIHPYIAKKRIVPLGGRIHKRDELVFPLYVMGGSLGGADELTSVQRILPSGRKLNWGGGRVSGSFWIIDTPSLETLKGKAVFICEGVMTGFALRLVGARGEGEPPLVAICYGASNFLHVAKAIFALGALPILCPDEGAILPQGAENFKIVAMPVGYKKGADWWDVWQKKREDSLTPLSRAASPHEKKENPTCDDIIITKPEKSVNIFSTDFINRCGHLWHKDVCLCAELHILYAVKNRVGGGEKAFICRSDAQDFEVPCALRCDLRALAMHLTSFDVKIFLTDEVMKLLKIFFEEADHHAPVYLREPKFGWTADETAFCIEEGVICLDGSQSKVATPRGVIRKITSVDPELIEAWKERVGNPVAKESLGVVVLGAAFCAPLLQKLGQEGFGLHVWGESSLGKTILQRAATSVFASPEEARTLTNWNCTRNAAEEVLELHNHRLLAIDELTAEVSNGNVIFELLYSITQGQGRKRCAKNGKVLAPRVWQTIFLSSGEHSMWAHLKKAGHDAQAGQMVRVLDLRVDSECGVFDSLRWMGADARSTKAKALSSALADKEIFGVTGIAFVLRVMQDTQDYTTALRGIKEKLFDSLDKEQPEIARSTQQSRAADTLGLVLLSYHIASSYDLVPPLEWTEDLQKTCGQILAAVGTTRGAAKMDASGRLLSWDACKVVLQIQRAFAEFWDTRFAEGAACAAGQQCWGKFLPRGLERSEKTGSCTPDVAIISSAFLKYVVEPLKMDLSEALTLLERAGILVEKGKVIKISGKPYRSQLLDMDRITDIGE